MKNTRKCSSLQYGEFVVFKTKSIIIGKKIPMDGSVVFVNHTSKTVSVSWMEGYREIHEDIPFRDMLAVHNQNGPVMQFDNISGKSDLLIAE